MGYKLRDCRKAGQRGEVKRPAPPPSSKQAERMRRVREALARIERDYAKK